MLVMIWIRLSEEEEALSCPREPVPWIWMMTLVTVWTLSGPADGRHLPVVPDQTSAAVQVARMPVREIRVPEFQRQFLPRRWFLPPHRPVFP